MKRQQMILLGSFAAGLVVVAYLSWSFLFQPIRADIAQAQVTLEAEKTKLEEAKSKAAQYEKFQAEAENVRRGLNFVTSRLDSRLPYLEQVNLLNGLGKGLGLRNYLVALAKSEASKDYPGLTEIKATIKFDSGYHQAGLFLNQVVSQRRILVPIDIHFTSKDPTGRKPSAGIETNIKIYFNTPPAPK